ncbi:hypothetical protein DL766_000883 [Monosporascus sp. MC13-8B]|uniref:Uncharacterized protein n=1 Tax=Monosporascus cannonballus TaxID=155416 RepID=A0ABY0GRJ9_9PEZI|nr:hypothetical protein DL762_010212 [Monosporascus cannonballus]RYO94081.1 hypothetical protein DL763_004149 [Monosporascus cannonballus]RYP38673.1 hypothetical protein DL766_000883 [Monosporascus sp. MC13-8B]
MPCNSADDELDGNDHSPCQDRPNAIALASTADYHRSLLDQHQHSASNSWSKPELQGSQQDSRRRCVDSATGALTATFSKSRKTGKSPHPEFTPQDLEEFESLPIAIRRKCFSTLERLRLARTSAFNQNPHQHHRTNNASGVTSKSTQRPTTSPLLDQTRPLPAEYLFLAKLPAKIREKYLTKEEQLLLARQLKESVILDAADEAIYRIGRRASSRPSPCICTPPLPPSPKPSMEALEIDKKFSDFEKTHNDLYDSFRWLDDDEELDLRLVFDDCRTHLRESPVPKTERRPPFRRHLSISKIPFGNRMSSDFGRPETKETAVSYPVSPAVSSFVLPLQHARRRSRALSLITPKHTTQDSVTSIDPAAAHYQDPEARLKLRVYLSSPQKFDEAIEFGFPSNDVLAAEHDNDDQLSAKRHPRRMLSQDSEVFKTFLSDDRSSFYSEDISMPDPESPRTPHLLEHPPLRLLQRTNKDDGQSKPLEGYVHVPVASREMTLRMTLTRPDLRAYEDQIHGWSRGAYQPSSNIPQSSPFRDDQSTIQYVALHLLAQYPPHPEVERQRSSNVDRDAEDSQTSGAKTVSVQNEHTALAPRSQSKTAMLAAAEKARTN